MDQAPMKFAFVIEAGRSGDTDEVAKGRNDMLIKLIKATTPWAVIGWCIGLPNSDSCNIAQHLILTEMDGHDLDSIQDFVTIADQDCAIAIREDDRCFKITQDKFEDMGYIRFLTHASDGDKTIPLTHFRHAVFGNVGWCQITSLEQVENPNDTSVQRIMRDMQKARTYNFWG